MAGAPGDVSVPTVTVTLAEPAPPAGDVAVIEVDELTVTSVAGLPPKLTVAPGANPVPVIVTTVPPAVEPPGGERAVTSRSP